MKEVGKRIFKTIKNPPILRVVSPLQRFIQQEATSSKILMACIFVGLIWANIPWGDTYNFVWETIISINIGNSSLSQPLLLWINDGLMVLFFFVIGLELKREVLIGGLSDLKDSLLSIVAAIGGMIFPAIFFIIINPPSSDGAVGWNIPIATDIAMAIGVLSFFSYKIPRRIKLFLTSMAIFDDLASIIIIAIFHSSNLNWAFIGISLGIVALLVIFNLIGIRNSFFYLVPGVFLWGCVLLSGVHATVSGVILAATIPATKRIDLADFYSMSKKSLNDISEIEIDTDEVSCYNRVITQVYALEDGFRNIQAPLQILEHKLIGISAFIVVPLFALANSGVNFFTLGANPFTERVFWGVFCGLVLGKPMGILIVVSIMSRFKSFKLPANVNWLHIVGMACLMGIGFTMSSFLAGLAFASNEMLLSSAKIAILLGSLLSGIIGYVVLHFSVKKMELDLAKKSSTEEISTTDKKN
ncbi:MAG: Na+/H+ antiporter NhaA [Candidatus Heimdallarchaeota archaeon]|nr:Na+/H+ antiporter NhaA [Candidatus Heimdallarchaeota archaeon]